MKLFHGTNRKFENVDLEKSKDKRDFGKGFYTTTIFEQAEKWAKNQLVRYGGEGSFVKEFEFQQDSSLKIKVFSEMDADWLEFVRMCRTEGGTPHDYDISKVLLQMIIQCGLLLYIYLEFIQQNRLLNS